MGSYGFRGPLRSCEKWHPAPGGALGAGHSGRWELGCAPLQQSMGTTAPPPHLAAGQPCLLFFSACLCPRLCPSHPPAVPWGIFLDSPPSS